MPLTKSTTNISGIGNVTVTEFSEGNLLFVDLSSKDMSIGKAEMIRIGEYYTLEILVVSVYFRGRGVSKILLNRLIKLLDKDPKVCFCELNPYGGLGVVELKNLLGKYGFVDSTEEQRTKYGLVALADTLVRIPGNT